MPGMPYHLEKGPLLSVVDDFFNGDQQRSFKALDELRKGTALTDIGVFDSPNLYGPGRPKPYEKRAQLVAHFNEHWLGHAPLNPQTQHKQTGHWQFYKGPVEDIVRETLIRALELSLGIPHEDETAQPTRHWPIDFWWKCPQPWFEGWVSWRQGGWGGKVTVIFATPADDGVVLRLPRKEAVDAPGMINQQSEGSWLISAERHNQTIQFTTVPTGSGQLVFPSTWTVDDGPVVALAPKFGSGGAQNGGFPYLGSK